MKRASFTLVELLVVIGIIGILAALVIPAVGLARASGKKTDCINNKNQLIKMMQFYASDNKDAMIYRSGKGTSAYNYAAVLTGSKDTTKRYMGNETLKCSLDKEKIKDSGNDYYSNVVGMLNAAGADKLDDTASYATSTWIGGKYKTFGSFASSKDEKTIIYDSSMFKSPGSLLLFADTFKQATSGNPGGEAYWNFTPAAASNSNYYVTLIHNGHTTGAFADGHAEGMDGGRLKECATEVKKFLGDDFNKDKVSDSL